MVTVWVAVLEAWLYDVIWLGLIVLSVALISYYQLLLVSHKIIYSCHILDLSSGLFLARLETKSENLYNPET